MPVFVWISSIGSTPRLLSVKECRYRSCLHREAPQSGPPTIASGTRCPMQGPPEVPENLPSVTMATDLSSPMSISSHVAMTISLIPGPPFGPSYRMTMTSPSLILPASRALMQSSSCSKTLAGPLCFCISGSHCGLFHHGHAHIALQNCDPSILASSDGRGVG